MLECCEDITLPDAKSGVWLNSHCGIRYTKCVILGIKDFLDFMTLLFKLSLLPLNDGLCICTAFKKHKIRLWDRFRWDVEIPELALTRLR